MTKFFLTTTLPKTSLFWLFKNPFSFFSFFARMKLADPLKLSHIHQDFTKSLKPSSLSHIFLDLKGEGPLRNPPTSNKIREWFDTGLGKIHCITLLKWPSHSLDTRTRSNLERALLFKPPLQVKDPPSKGRSLNWRSSMTFVNLLIAEDNLEAPVRSPGNLTTLKSPPMHHGSVNLLFVYYALVGCKNILWKMRN